MVDVVGFGINFVLSWMDVAGESVLFMVPRTVGAVGTVVAPDAHISVSSVRFIGTETLANDERN